MSSDEGGSERFVVGVDRERLSFVAGVLFACGLACLGMYKPWTRSWFTGWLALAILPTVVSRRNDRRPLLVLDFDGLSAPRTGLRKVAWTDVRRVRLSDFARMHTLCVEVERIDEYVGPLSAWQSFLLTISLGRLGRELRIDLTYAELPAREIFDEVTRRCEQGAFPTGKFWH